MPPTPDEHLIGLISDTHGLLRREAVNALRGSDLIIHAGDIVKPEILESLKAMAPTVAVRGNCDAGRWTEAVADTEVVEIGGISIYVLHDLEILDLEPEAGGFKAVIYGHTHKPLIEERRGVLYVNPGSAGPRRFSLPVSVGRLHVKNGSLRAEIVELT
ncbi:MAG: metallophosphoesterase family protein [Acidobacteriota bacterium]